MSFAVYRSSAGSGKTFSLVLEYLKMVMQDPPGFRHILAITFTNKAANEMRERVMQALQELARGGETGAGSSVGHLQRRLEEETHLSREEVAQRAQEALSLILHHYSEFAVGTIDSFSHRVIRAFAHDFGLPVSFSVEIEADELLTTAVHLVLERAGQDEELTRVLVGFLESEMEEDRGWNIDNMLVEFAGQLLDEEGRERIAEVASLTLNDFLRISRQLHRLAREAEQSCRVLGEEGLNIMDQAGIPPAAFYHGNSGVPGYFRNLADGKVEKLAPNSWVTAALEDDRWAGPKATPSELESIRQIQQPLKDILTRGLELKEREWQHYHLRRLLLRTIYPLALLNEIGRMLEAFKRQLGTVHISEFNSRIARIVLAEPVPFIYERLGEKYRHVLIDEFQDTSRLQWFNLVPLMENALAGGYFNLVVGDGKQAIYRWRDGDVTQFTALPALPGSDRNPLIKQREAAFSHAYEERRLDSNFRSAPVIVNFNNRFFEWLSQHLAPSLQQVYRDAAQKPNPGRDGGYISLEFLPSDQSAGSYSDQTINRTESIIRHLMDEGCHPGDIAVLCRSNRQAGQVARELILRGIDVVSSESLLLSYSPEVRFITALIRSLSEPANTILQASVVHFLHYRGLLPRETQGFHSLLSEIGTTADPSSTLFNILRRNGWNADAETWAALPLYDLCETLIRIFDLNRQADPYIQFFLDAVIDYTEKKEAGAAGFSDWWEAYRNTRSIVVPEGLDAVRVMTIHKAKGLEFSVVIFPFADESLRKTTKKYLWTEMPEGGTTGLKTAFVPAIRQLLETPLAGNYLEETDRSFLDLVNILYVVMTRPREQLYILTPLPGPAASELRSLPVIFSSYLKETGLWKEGTPRYQFGEGSYTRSAHPEAETEVRMLSSLPSTDWRPRIHIRQRAPERWDIQDPSGRVDFGIRVHALLAGITYAADLEDAMEVAILSGSLAPEERSQIRDMAVNVMEHPLLSGYFRPGVEILTEPEILVPGGESYRPDRVVFGEGETVVIDFKTGKESEAHAAQITLYGQLLEEMGFRNLRKMIVYVRERVEVVEVKA